MYGKVKFCPYCGNEARDVVATGRAGADFIFANQIDQPLSRFGIDRFSEKKTVAENVMTAKSLSDTTAREASAAVPLPLAKEDTSNEVLIQPLLPAASDNSINVVSPPKPVLVPAPQRTKWLSKLVVIGVLAGVGLWYLKKSSAPVSISAPPQISTTAPKSTKKPHKIAPKPTMSVVSVGDALSPFPISESGKHLDGMLNGAKDGNDASIMNARRLLQGVVLPPRGDRKRARTFNVAALDALQKGDSMEAVNLLLNAVKADPADQEIVNNLAYALYKAQRLQEALDAVVAALTVAPERAAAWANLGMIQADLGKTDIAVAAFMLSHRFSQNQQKTKDFLQKLIQEESSAQVRAAAEKALSQISAIPTPVQ